MIAKLGFTMLLFMVGATWVVVEVARALVKRIQEDTFGGYGALVRVGLALLLTVWSGVVMTTSAARVTVRGASKVMEVGRDAVSGMVSFGTTTLLEGVGKTADHFEQKWDAAARERAGKLEVTVQDAELTERMGGRILRVTLSLFIAHDRDIDLNDLLGRQLFLLQDSRELCFPIDRLPAGEAIIPPGVRVGRVLEISLPVGVEPRAIVTPRGVLTLPLESADSGGA